MLHSIFVHISYSGCILFLQVYKRKADKKYSYSALFPLMNSKRHGDVDKKGKTTIHKEENIQRLFCAFVFHFNKTSCCADKMEEKNTLVSSFDKFILLAVLCMLNLPFICLFIYFICLYLFVYLFCSHVYLCMCFFVTLLMYLFIFIYLYIQLSNLFLLHP